MSESLASLGYSLLIGAHDGWLNTHANYNLSPSQHSLLVASNDGKGAQCTLASWGFVQPARGGSKGFAPINARGETMFEKALFKGAAIRGRCIIPTNGYYEWAVEDGGKRPYLLRVPGADVTWLGALQRVDRESGVRQFVVVTNDAHPTSQAIHERQPLIVTASKAEQWLGGGEILDTATQAHLLEPVEVEYWRVAQAVSSPSNNSADLMNEVSEPRGSGLFQE